MKSESKQTYHFLNCKKSSPLRRAFPNYLSLTDNIRSLITFCKPCFVPSYCKRPSSCTPVVIIYLQVIFNLSFFLVHFLKEGAPTIIWVSRSWGLPRSTLLISKQAPSLWHFQGIHTIS